MNKAFIIGRLTKDVELRFTQSGIAVANFTVAVDRPFTNTEGKKETDFIPIVVWRKLAENCANHIGKGGLVAVSGRIQVSSWKNEQGERRNKTEIVADEVQFLDWPKDQPRSDYDDSIYNLEAFEQTEGVPF